MNIHGGLHTCFRLVVYQLSDVNLFLNSLAMLVRSDRDAAKQADELNKYVHSVSILIAR